MASEGSGCKTGDALILDPLDTDTVSVRWLSLEAADAGHLSRWRRMLDDSELRRANSYNFAPDRETFITAHALTRAMLSSATGKPTAAWRYVGGEFGKPYLAPGCTAGGLQFNLSQTRGFVACAVAYREVGVDVESTDRLTDIDIADTVFAPEEALLVKTAPPERQRYLFFRFWTLKEAFIKATGEGLRRPLDSFSFELDPIRIRFHPERLRGSHPDDPEGWQFAEDCPLPNRHLALAFRHTPSGRVRLDVRAVRPEEIAPG
jgi:4'-phosphopantetheinyl transferase